MHKKTIILLVFLLLIFSGLFYFFFLWTPEESLENQNSPILFNREDYIIQEQGNSKYLIVEKAGFSCKIPDDWTIEIEGSDIPEPSYWANLLSPDANMNSTLNKTGCGITVMAEKNEERWQKMSDNIKLIKNGQTEIENMKEGYTLNTLTIKNYEGLNWISPEHEILGQTVGINFILDQDTLITVGATLLPNYKQQCQPIWDEFLQSIVIK